MEGWNGYVMQEKLKLLKAKLKSWSWEVFGNVDYRIKNLEMEIGRIDTKAELMGLNEKEVNNRSQQFVDL